MRAWHRRVDFPIRPAASGKSRLPTLTRANRAATGRPLLRLRRTSATLSAVPFVSSDPHAWMRPYYERMASQEGFAMLAIPIQFAALVNLIAQDHPAKAAKLREIRRSPHATRRPRVSRQHRLHERGCEADGRLP